MNEFIDEITISVQAGKGGDGCASFRKEKFIPYGGPDGGDGGKGGSIYLLADPNLYSLIDYKYQKHYKAQAGEHGQGSLKTGSGGKDLILKVPCGTVIWEADTHNLIGEVCKPDDKLLVAQGGRGGRGNAHFATAVKRAPRRRELGAPGDELKLKLELKLLAEVGIIGFPNAGKSTLLARISAAQPKIAPYPFTTLNPNLGVAYHHEQPVIFADLPGLIAGAHQGKGLGLKFLRHIERTRLLLHLMDVSALDPSNPLAGYFDLLQELAQFNPGLLEKPQILAANKIDLELDARILPELKAACRKHNLTLHLISAQKGDGIEPLLQEIFLRLGESQPPRPEPVKVNLQPAGEAPWKVSKTASGYQVSGKKIERLIAQTDFADEENIMILQKKLKRWGVEQALIKAGITEGETVTIGGWELEFYPD